MLEAVYKSVLNITDWILIQFSFTQRVSAEQSLIVYLLSSSQLTAMNEKIVGHQLPLVSQKTLKTHKIEQTFQQCDLPRHWTNN